jgi:hypothetical protein
MGGIREVRFRLRLPCWLDWWNYKFLRVAWVRFKQATHKPLTDTERIQYAIDKGGFWIIIKAGSYRIKHPIIMQSFQRLEGEM